MKLYSLTAKLLFLIACTFIITTAAILILADMELTRIIDAGQKAINQHRITVIAGYLEVTYNKLLKTGLVDAYEAEYKALAIENLHKYVKVSEKDAMEVFILDADGKNIFNHRLPQGEIAPIVAQSKGRLMEESHGDFDYTAHGEPRWCIFKQFDPWHWTIGYTMPLDLKYASVKTFSKFLFFIMAGIGLAAILLLSFVVARFTRPITRLTHISMQMAQGDLNQEIKISSRDEIGVLARSFEAMRDAIARDITQRKAHELELKRLRNYLSNIIDSMPSILIGVDKDGMVTQWNKTAEKTTGIDETSAIGCSLADVFPKMADEISQINDSIRSGQPSQKRKLISHPEKGTLYQDMTIYPLIADGVEGAVIRVDDVTEKVRLEEMMVQSEKMLSVGGLAAGMAHEINNPLAGMLQTANVLERRLSCSETLPANIRAAEKNGISLESLNGYMNDRGIPKMLYAIKESGVRMAGIVQNMLSFSRKSDAQICLCALDEVMDKTLELAATDYDMKKEHDFKLIHIIKEYEPVPKVPCEQGKIQQVLLNILRNGAQAMQEAGIAAPSFTLRIYLQPILNLVCMEIEDNGPGMDEKTRKRIFEPFFTTKPVGIGTGLGLSVSYFIIKETHKGDIWAQSHPGKGTKFYICLPVKTDIGRPEIGDRGPEA